MLFAASELYHDGAGSLGWMKSASLAVACLVAVPLDEPPRKDWPWRQQLRTWNGLVAPAGTPNDVIVKVHDEVVRILKLPDVRERFAGLGMEPVGDTPQQFAQYLRSEVARFERIVRQSGIRAE